MRLDSVRARGSCRNSPTSHKRSTYNRWYYLDRSTRGDITAIRNASGALQATARYSAYGELAWKYEAGVTSALTDALAHAYNGRDGVVDLGGGLEWMGHRVYSAIQSKFLASDSEESTTGSTASASNYADNNPVNLIDPDGCRAFTGYWKFLSGRQAHVWDRHHWRTCHGGRRKTGQFYPEFMDNSSKKHGKAQIAEHVTNCMNNVLMISPHANDNQGRERLKLYCEFYNQGDGDTASVIGRGSGSHCGPLGKWMVVWITWWDDDYWSVRTAFPINHPPDDAEEY